MKLHLLIFLSIIVVGCNSMKGVVGKKDGNIEDAIQIAILDFSKIKKLYKNDSVFCIFINKAPNNDDVMVLEIGRNNTKLLLTKDVIIGSKGKIPSRYMEKDGKLFFWWDKDTPLTNETLTVFRKYNLLQDDENGMRKGPSFIIDETKKAVHYYFCKNDLSKYKKVITNIGLGYYNPPSLECVNISK